MRAQIRAQSGASGTQKVAAACPDKVTRQDGALPMRQKGKRKWGNLTAQGRKINNSTIR